MREREREKEGEGEREIVPMLRDTVVVRDSSKPTPTWRDLLATRKLTLVQPLAALICKTNNFNGQIVTSDN